MRESWGFLIVGDIFLAFAFALAFLKLLDASNILIVFSLVFNLIAFIFALKDISDAEKRHKKLLEKMILLEKVRSIDNFVEQSIKSYKRRKND